MSGIFPGSNEIPNSALVDKSLPEGTYSGPVEVDKSVLPNGEVQVFYSTFQSISYFFKDGRQASFVSGQYATPIIADINELKLEIARGHPHMSMGKVIEARLLDPMEVLRDKFIAEYKASVAAAQDPSKQSTSDSGKLNPASTANLGGMAIGGGSNPELSTAAQLLAARAASISAQ